MLKKSRLLLAALLTMTASASYANTFFNTLSNFYWNSSHIIPRSGFTSTSGYVHAYGPWQSNGCIGGNPNNNTYFDTSLVVYRNQISASVAENWGVSCAGRSATSNLGTVYSTVRFYKNNQFITEQSASLNLDGAGNGTQTSTISFRYPSGLTPGRYTGVLVTNYNGAVQESKIDFDAT